MTVEYRCTCRKCGAYWCINENDLNNNKRKKFASRMQFVSGLLDATDRRTIGSIYSGETSARLANSTRDYSRCPKCGSINVAVQKHQF